ncbi:MAG: BlaI/MecI/CopY family transcriptional regulator [Syntrophomonadaceae bacterium]|nr:BlaI/MecI/CopY family transcriptional regulator [Syntrophomonadaceae bacterium]
MIFTANELQFMTVLWNAEEPLTGMEILKRSADKNWKDASLHTILNKMLQKGAVREVGFKKKGKAISRTFEPAISCDEYYAGLFNAHTNNDPKTIPLIFSALLRREDISRDTIEQLEELIRRRKAKL